jgi:hypothetical protein
VPPIDRTEEDFDLYTRFGAPGYAIYMKIPNHSVTLGRNRLAWIAENRLQEVSLYDISAIHLLTATQSVQGPMGATLCQIVFRTGLALTVFPTNEYGLYDRSREARYREFVEALHARLDARQRAAIRFVAGYGSIRYWLLLFLISLLTLMMAGGLLAALVLGAFTWKLVFSLFVGVSMTGAMIRLLQVNAPHAYDPANPIASAATGSIGDTIAHAWTEFRRTMTAARAVKLWVAGAAVVAIVVLVIGAQHSANLFEPDRARHAYETILGAEYRHTVTKVRVTPDELMVRFPEPHGDSAQTEWRASRASLFGWTEWDRLSGPRVNYDISVYEEGETKPFDAQADDAANLAGLAQTAIERAGAGKGGVVTEMTLTKAPDYIRPEPPHWTVQVRTNGDSVREVLADRSGKLFPATPDPAGPPRIVISAISDSWFRIINPDHSVRYEDILKSGKRYEVPDIPGMLLQTGKPDGLAFTVDGRPAPPLPGGMFNQVEVTLNPQALVAGTALRK